MIRIDPHKAAKVAPEYWRLLKLFLKGNRKKSKLEKYATKAKGYRRQLAYVDKGLVDSSTIALGNPDDIKMDVYRASGAGGQHINKTSSAVRLTHIPTGIVVSCQTQRSQIQNREIAMQMLRTKMYANMLAEQQEKIGNERRLKIGTGERSEKIRTYNYPQNRVTDHRIGFTIQKLDRVIEGELDEVIEALIHYDQSAKMAGE